MNGVQILELLGRDPETIAKCWGVYARDRLPPDVPVDRFCICNTDSWKKAGKHWILIYFPPDGVTEFFDPLGNKPSAEFVPFMGENYVYNTQRYQPLNSNSCALYCIFFAYMKCRGLLFQTVLGFLDKEKNVVRFVHNM